MKHNNISSGMIGDLISPVEMGATQKGQQIARFKIAFGEIRQDANGQQQFFKHIWLASAFGETAVYMQKIPLYSTIMFSGKLDRYKMQNQQGGDGQGKDEYIVRYVLLNCALVGPSDFAHLYGQQGQQQYGNPSFSQDFDSPYPSQLTQPPVYPSQSGMPQYPQGVRAPQPFVAPAPQPQPAQHIPNGGGYQGIRQAQPYPQAPVSGRNPLDDIPF